MDGLARTVQMLRRDLLVPRLREVGIEHDKPSLGLPEPIHVADDLVAGLLGRLLVVAQRLYLEA